MLTFERANELLRYDPSTGKLYWRVRRPGGRAKDEAGTLLHGTSTTYRRIGIDGVWRYAHHIVWLLHYGVWSDVRLAHLNGDGLDNRVENLRDMSRNNTSGITGVFWHKARGKWVAQIRVEGKQKYLGCFPNKEDAVAARRKAADESGYTERLLRQRGQK